VHEFTREGKSFLKSGRSLVEYLFPDKVSDFVEDASDCWNDIQNIPSLPPGSDVGANLSNRLRKLLPITKGVLKMIRGTVVTLSPHSMQVERIVSHYNLTASPHRMSFSSDTMNTHLLVALNGCGTASYDPRPAVALFFKRRERRYQEPNLETYTQREFIKSFSVKVEI